MHQAPAPELTRLRLPDHSWTMPAPVTVHPAKSLPVPGVHGSALEVAVTLQPAEDATDAASVYLLSDDAEHRPYGGGEAPADDCYGVAVTVSWREKTLKVSSSCRPDGRPVATLRRHAHSAVVATVLRLRCRQLRHGRAATLLAACCRCHGHRLLTGMASRSIWPARGVQWAAQSL